MAIADFTVLPGGAVTRGNRKIATCPKCGRNGELRKSAIGSSIYLHTGEVIKSSKSLLPIDYCRIEAAD